MTAGVMWRPGFESGEIDEYSTYASPTLAPTSAPPDPPALVGPGRWSTKISAEVKDGKVRETFLFAIVHGPATASATCARYEQVRVYTGWQRH